MANPIKVVEFTTPTGQTLIRCPVPWSGLEPRWLREHGKTLVAVIDDQIQSLADLTDEDELKSQIIDPMNVEFVFFGECARGRSTAKDRAWFEPVARQLGQMRDRLALVLLDVMFDDESDALSGSGIAFLKLLDERKVVGDVQIVIMTQAQDETRLRTAISHGDSRDFLSKSSDMWFDGLRRMLCQYAWISEPRFPAFAPHTRKEAAILREYAISEISRRQRSPLGGRLPSPILFTAPSGGGKSWMAKTTAQWLFEWTPAICSRQHVEFLDCNALGAGQSARTRLFGRGPLTPQVAIGNRRARGDVEVADASGLVERGATQLAANAILLVDEIGNSSQEFQNYLITFVETGRTEPEFRTNTMTREAVGELDVLCIFTATPAHISDGKISVDMQRRFSRGVHFEIPLLRDRPRDVLPIFYQGIKRFWSQSGWAQSEPDDIDHVLSSNAQEYLLEAVVDEELSTSSLIDLIGHPAPGSIIGESHLKRRLQEIRKRQPKPSVLKGYDSLDSGTATPISDPNDKIASLLEAAAEVQFGAFPRDRDTLADMRQNVYRAAANLLLRFLEAGAYANRKPKGEVDIANTARTLFEGLDNKDHESLTTRLKSLIPLALDRELTIQLIRESDMLAAIAVGGADRAKPIAKLLSEISADPSQATRLKRFGWDQDGASTPSH